MFIKAIIGIVLNAGALYGVTYFLKDEVSYTGGFLFFLIGGGIMGLLNILIKPLLKVLTFPFILLFSGLTLIAINTFLLYLLQVILETLAIPDVTLKIVGFGTHILAGIIFGVLNWFEHLLIHNR